MSWSAPSRTVSATLCPSGKRRGLSTYRPGSSSADVAEPFAWVFFEAAFDQSSRRRGYVIPPRLGLDHGGDDRGRIVAAERAPAGQHFVEHRAKRPDVGALVDRLASRLF